MAFLLAITVLMTGENRETAARMMNTQLMGRVKKVPTSPLDRIRARRKFFSIIPPRMTPRMMGGRAKSSFCST